jgi:hypothetical protein
MQVFLFYVSVAHFHVRAAVDAYHRQVAYGGDEPVVAPEVGESFAGTLAPVVLVVARNHCHRVFYA